MSGESTFMVKLSNPVHLEGFEVTGVMGAPTVSDLRVFAAPELLMDDPVSPNVPTSSSDVFAAGLVLVQYAYRHMCYRHDSTLTLENRTEAVCSVLHAPCEAHPKIHDVINRCIHTDPADRSSSRSVLQLLEQDGFAIGRGIERSGIVCP
jgi:serine/threonine protein kinase